MTRLPLQKNLAAVAMAAIAAMNVMAPDRAAAQDVPPADQLLPSNVYLYATVPDIEEVRQRGGESSFGALWQDPKFDDVKEEIKAKFQESAGKIRESLGVTVEELRSIPSGEVSLAICDVSGSLGMVALIEYSDESAETLDALTEKAETALEERGASRSNVDFEGTEITLYEGAEAEDGADSESSDQDLPDLDIDGDSDSTDSKKFQGKIAWFRKDGRIVVGNDVPILEAVLARWDGAHDETFAADEVYTYISDKVRADARAPLFFWYADPIGGLQTALSSAESLPPQAQMIAGMLPMLGLTSLEGIGGGFDLATSKFNSVSNTFIYVEPPPGGDLGLLALFQLLPGELAPPAWVSGQVTAYVGAHWDAAGALEAARRLTDTFQGPGFFDRLMEKAATAEGGPKIHPKTDLIDRLSGEVHLANYPVDAPPEDAEKPPQQPTVIALEVNDEVGMKDVLSRLANTPNFPGKSREFEGNTLYELPTGAQAQGPIAVTIANESLMFSSSVERMEEILRETGGGGQLAESDAFQRVADFYPDEQLMISYQDQQDQLKVVYEMFRTGNLGKQVEGFDFSTLPPFEEIEGYLRRGGGYAVSDERGALFVGFTLKEASE